jgi:hypothetical protein
MRHIGRLGVVRFAAHDVKLDGGLHQLGQAINIRYAYADVARQYLPRLRRVQVRPPKFFIDGESSAVHDEKDSEITVRS